MSISKSCVENIKVIANGHALVSKVLERTEALPNQQDTDRSLDSPESEQSLEEVQQFGRMLLSSKINKLTQ